MCAVIEQIYHVRQSLLQAKPRQRFFQLKLILHAYTAL